MARTTKPRVAVIGLGFVGLTTALGFARKGFTVRGYDQAERITRLETQINFVVQGIEEIKHLIRNPPEQRR